MAADPTTPRRRLRHRVPLSLRQHWKLLAVSVAALVVVVLVLGDTRVRPYITADADVIASPITENVTGTVELFDPDVAHEIHLEIDDVEYAEMIDAFERNGDKDWVTADLTIDGEFINDVAVRLKGNSTLMGLRGEEGRPGGAGRGDGGRGDGGPPAMPEGTDLPEGMPRMPENVELPAGMEMPAGAPGGMAAPGMDAGISADDPASLPLLISFDENYDGRAYQGMTELSVRPGTPVLNEAVALELTEATGQATQRYAYSEYSVNDGPTTSRLVLEHPDDGYTSSAFDGPGYLYKADANSRFEYVGEDQSDYSDQFSQVNAEGEGTMQPIIDLLRWVDSASDEEFAAELDQWIDVESFAEYVATQNLLSNFDDMSGPGQNYYLWYDLGTEKFTVVSWDLNMAMSGDATAGPHDTVSMGGPGAMGGPGGMSEPPAGVEPPAGTELPAGMEPPAGMPMGGPPSGGENPAGESPGDERGGRRGPSMDHPLKTRFLESDAFTELYEQTYWQLYDEIYGSGLAVQTLDRVRQQFPLSDEVDSAAVDEEAAILRAWIDQRTAALAEKQPA
ncbi:CotH kinase family protein [Dietzia massiliensis]|uniref:CotH kinase family protein n=1 Tax=Dietzia massiliensis TaxID=2697499 RepID=UPI001BCD9CBF|nr:CotH kinase family protein [Dietzia massiliensis]MBS7548295.1 CotH kinase family protein [Dietzia massiliensis]